MPSEVLRIHECVLFKNEEEEEEDAAPFAVHFANDITLRECGCS